MNEYLIWYHKEDNDGVFSAAVIYNYLVHNIGVKPEDITLEGMTYAMFTDKFPNEDAVNFFVDYYKYKNIIMTDISCNEYKTMKLLYNIYGKKFIWFDHHKPIIELSAKYKFDGIEGWRDTSRSAILNAYRYLFDPLDEKYMNKDVPELLRILSAYDSWSYKREHIKFDKCRNVNKGVTVHFGLDVKKAIEYTKKILYYDPSKVINPEANKFIREMHKLGKELNEYDDFNYKAQLESYGDYDWKVNGRKAVMLVCQCPTSSLMFKSLQNTEYKAGIVLKPLPTGKWVLSLYNIKTEYDDEFQCNDYLRKKYNGGGHAGAAGATLSSTQAMKMLKTKTV